MTQDHKSHDANDSKDGPYRRVGILALIAIAIIVLFFGINLIAKGFGGNERRLAEAFIATLQKPYVNGSFALNNQAQTNSFEVKGDVKFTNGEAVSLESTIALSEQGGEEIKVPVDARINLKDSTEYFVKASSLEKIARPLGEMAPTINADLLSIADKIEGKWLKYSPGDNAAQGCATAIFDTLQDDSDAVKELTRVYMGHRFIEVNSVDKKNDTTQVYEVAVDNDALTAFNENLYKSDFVANIDACKDEVEAASAAAPAQQAQPQQAQPEQPATRTTITVRDGLIAGMSSSNAAQGNATSLSLTLDFDKNDITMPTDDIVDSASIQHEGKAIAEYIVEQQQQQQQASQQQAGGAGSQMMQP